ncbi:hypothetical protein [Nocardia vulneris]|uniref:hypothetical protein n=1 Tax=Nocardia vulneris TaxID=1141657 RepID=UPI0012E03D02|nr:hypothetical protein [Nocardia vulneris]
MLVGSRRHPAISVAVALLSGHLTIPVFNAAPAVLPDSFVRITRVGGAKQNIVTDGPMLTFECWNPVSAEELAMQVLDIIENSPGEFVEYRSDDGTPRKAWISGYEEVGAPAQHPESDVQLSDRWVFTARLGIATNI